MLGVRSVGSLVGFERLSIILGPLRLGGGRRCFFCDVRLKKRGFGQICDAHFATVAGFLQFLCVFSGENAEIR